MNSQGYYEAPDPYTSNTIVHRMYELHWTLYLFIVTELDYPDLAGIPFDVVSELFGILYYD